ncbi:MAG TPA: hypothetical protein VEJ40_07540 [Pseudolabrys sp.]|nr:hypothetical protein [Pseudolabrys sp.]
MPTPRYRNALRALLTPAEHRIFARLNTPQKLQVYLEKLPPNFELKGETYMSPRRVLKAGTAHCAEAAVLAAAVLIYHGKPAWLVDIRALPSDQDHIITLFKERGLWGAISKTNHAVLRWRDPIYRSPRELVMTYAHEYNLDFGKKSMQAYSRPFPMTRHAPARWVIADCDLDWLMDELDAYPHEPVAPKHALDRRRRSTRVELKSQDVTEHPVPASRRVAKTK